MTLFEQLQDSIYSEVTTLISQRALYAIQYLVTEQLTSDDKKEELSHAGRSSV